MPHQHAWTEEAAKPAGLGTPPTAALRASSHHSHDGMQTVVGCWLHGGPGRRAGLAYNAQHVEGSGCWVARWVEDA
eukprot:4455863-Lingulodinium_polyedra.AAC.1